MQNQSKNLIRESLRDSVSYQLNQTSNGPGVERKYDLTDLGDHCLDLLAAEIRDGLLKARVLLDASEFARMKSTSDEPKDDDYFQLVRRAISEMIGLFEVRSGRDLGIAYPVYDIYAKRVFEALEEYGFLAEPEQCGLRYLLLSVAWAGGDAE